MGIQMSNDCQIRIAKGLGLFSFVVASLLASTALAQSVEKVTEVEGITEYSLENGARVLLYPDSSAGTVTVAMTVMVGSRHEGYGETGMAHLLEHMLFKGSPKHQNIPKEMKDRGATFNGTTWYDRTNYYETVPASDENLEWALDLESDRLVNSFVRGEDLSSEMTVVRNEFEIGENNPDQILFQRIMANAYEWHNYGKSPIGNRIDLERVPITSLRRFYKKFYQPDNIILVIAGKFDATKALALIQEKFGSLERPERVLEATYTEEPAQDGERTVVLRRVGDVEVVGSGYHIPAASHPDYPACQVLSNILGDEPGGVLYKDLVESKLAASVSTMEMAGHDPGMLLCVAQVTKDGSLEKTRDQLLQSIQGSAERITETEVKRAVKKLLKQRENLQTNTQNFATELSEWSAYGDWRLFFLHRDRLEKLSLEDVQRVAKRYLVTSNRTVGLFRPEKKPVRATIPERPNVRKLVAGYKGRKKLAEGEVLGTEPNAIEKRITRGKLSDGFHYALLPKESRGDVVRMQLTLRYGNEKSLSLGRHNDAADFLGTLMRRGTSSMGFQQLKDKLDDLKANLNSTSSTGEVSFSLRAKRNTILPALEILADVLRNPIFPEKEFEILKKQALTNAEQQKSDPQMLAINRLMRSMNPREPADIRYVPTIEESIERINKVTRDDVAGLYKKFLSGQYGELTMVGDFDDQAALAKVREILNGWNTEESFERIDDGITQQPKGESIVINTPDKKNAIYIAGMVLPFQDNHKDYEAMLIGNSILGGGALSNRLANRVRQKEGLSYMVQSVFVGDSRVPISRFLAVAMVNPKNRDALVDAMGDEMKRLRDSGVTDEEVEKAKQGLLQSNKRQRTNDQALLQMIHSQLSNDRTMDFVEEREGRIRGLTKQQVDGAIKQMLKLENLIIITAGDFDKEEKQADK